MTRTDEKKPLTGFAPPPLSAILTILIFISVSIYALPRTTSFSTEGEDCKVIFTRRIFPNLISFETLLCIRLVFVLICFGGFISGWITGPMTLDPSYRPNSQCPRIPMIVGGWRKQIALTSVTWNLLGTSIALVCYIGYLIEYGDDNNSTTNEYVLKWCIPIARICWEISAPMTLLVSAVVKYALWPAAQRNNKQKSGEQHVFQYPRALLQHNANSIMSVVEVTILGGLPVRLSHLALSVIFGSLYVVFSWSIMMTWHGHGPAFLYFFLDTTIGNEHTVALWVLLSVLMVFYGLFWSMGELLELMFVGGDNDGDAWVVVVGHVVYAIGLCALVCRFRD